MLHTSPDFSELMWLNPIGQSKIVGKIVALSSPRQFLDTVSISCVPLTVVIVDNLNVAASKK
jgi:hypothetical protein